MPKPTKAHVVRKHNTIKKEYNELVNGATGMQHSKAAKALADKYFMSVVSIENLVWGTGGYGKYGDKTDPNQMSMFGPVIQVEKPKTEKENG